MKSARVGFTEILLQRSLADIGEEGTSARWQSRGRPGFNGASPTSARKVVATVGLNFEDLLQRSLADIGEEGRATAVEVTNGDMLQRSLADIGEEGPES